jgi:uncharacterized metal-binding protein YceD (DUF177 family)
MERSLAAQSRTQLRIADLASRKPTDFDITPDAALRDTIAKELGILGLKKLRFAGQIVPAGKRDWTLTAQMGATVVQACVVSLEPVTTRIDETVERIYTDDVPVIDAAEVEMPEDDRVEALPETIDLIDVMREALSLALPLFPRVEGAELGQVMHTEPGKTPMTDDEAKPFAGLGALRDQLAKKDDDAGS